MARDDIMLSPCVGRDTCYIGIIMYRPYGMDAPRARYWDGFADIMRALGGRPHWAKEHPLMADEFAQLYPDFRRFCALRDQLDPGHLFSNAYLDRVLH